MPRMATTKRVDSSRANSATLCLPVLAFTSSTPTSSHAQDCAAALSLSRIRYPTLPAPDIETMTSSEDFVCSSRKTSRFAELFARISRHEIRSFDGSSIYSEEPPDLGALPNVAAIPPSSEELYAELSRRSNRAQTSLELKMDGSFFKRKHMRHTHPGVLRSAVRQLSIEAEMLVRENSETSGEMELDSNSRVKTDPDSDATRLAIEAQDLLFCNDSKDSIFQRALAKRAEETINSVIDFLEMDSDDQYLIEFERRSATDTTFLKSAGNVEHATEAEEMERKENNSSPVSDGCGFRGEDSKME